jgi:hypothetical protein
MQLVKVISQKDALQVQREENNGKKKGLVVFKSKFHLIHALEIHFYIVSSIHH